jgi:hypothetical protein
LGASAGGEGGEGGEGGVAGADVNERCNVGNGRANAKRAALKRRTNPKKDSKQNE